MAEQGCPRILPVDDDVNTLAGLRRNLPLCFDVTLAIGAEETLGGGVICDPLALPCAVIPAKAGIHSASYWNCTADRMHSRLRGNDQCIERGSIPNDTTTRRWN
jgi:hypothetical protein